MRAIDNIVIQSGVPIPESRRIGAGQGWASLIRRMNVGDSFALPATNKVQSRFSATAKAVGAKCVTRTLTENGAKVVRVWRTA